VAPQRIHVIHPGVDAKSFECPAKRLQGIQEQYGLGQSKVQLTVGRLQRRKGQDMVIRALPKIQEQFPDVKYLIVDQGEGLVFLQHLPVKSVLVEVSCLQDVYQARNSPHCTRLVTYL